MDEQTILHCLFGYETQGGRNSYIWHKISEPLNPKHPYRDLSVPSHLKDAYNAWIGGKRKFTHDEVIRGEWIKHSDTGLSFVVKFHPNGRLTERSHSDDSRSWEGSWKIADGILMMQIDKYELDIVANNSGNQHSGIEFTYNPITSPSPNAYFKLIHEDNDPLGIR